MLVKLPQMKQSWCMALVTTLQTQLSNRESLTENTDIKKMKDSGFDLNNNFRTMKISDCCISESNKKRLDTLCSRMNACSSPSSCLLSCKRELMANQCEDQTDATEVKKPSIDQDEYNPMTYMEVDNFVQSEVIEISDDSQEAVPHSLKEVTNSPTIPKIRDITLQSPEISPTTEVSNLPDYSALHEPKEKSVNPLVALPTTHVPEVPNPPELEIMGMEVEPAAEDPIVDKYAHLKNHLRSSEDLDVEHVQEFISSFSENSPKTLVIISQFLEINTVSEASAVMLIRQFLSLENECSFQATIIFAEYCIGSWLGTLQQAGSRNLLATVGAFAQKHPKAFIEGVILKQFDATCLLWPQCDLIVKVMKNFEKETLQYLMEKLLQSKDKDSSSVWNDHMIQLLSAVLERKLDLDASIFEAFVNCLQVQSLPLANSLKFAKLVLMIINKYGVLVKPSLTTFKQMLEENNTFLKKSALTALKKLEE